MSQPLDISHHDSVVHEAPPPAVTDELRAEMRKQGKNPDLPPDHPINKFGKFRKAMIIVTLAYAGLLGNFHVAIILVAFQPIAKDLKASIPAIANCIGYAFLGMAFGPLVWNPLSRTAGRRFTYLLGSFLVIPMCVWCAQSKTYGSFVAARFIMGFVNSFSQTVPPSSIADVWIEEVIGSRMVLYVVMICIAPAVAPIFSSAIIYKGASWRNLFWFILGLCALQFIMFALFVPETMWNWDDEADNASGGSDSIDEKAEGKGADIKHIEAGHGANQCMRRGHVGPAWWPHQRPREFLSMIISPILMFRFFVISATSFVYGMLLAWSVSLTIILPQFFGPPPYSFSVIATGAAFLAFGIGGVLGIPLGGILGDFTMTYFQKKHGDRQPEYRLWACFPFLPFWLGSCLIIGFGLQNHLHWSAFLIGGGLMYVLLTAFTGILQTYVLETYISKGQDTQAVFTFWRLMWAFAVAFFSYQWGANTSWLSEFAIQGATGCGITGLLCALLIWKGKEIRRWQGMPEMQ